jgi:hypothetical protein
VRAREAALNAPVLLRLEHGHELRVRIVGSGKDGAVDDARLGFGLERAHRDREPIDRHGAIVVGERDHVRAHGTDGQVERAFLARNPPLPQEAQPRVAQALRDSFARVVVTLIHDHEFEARVSAGQNAREARPEARAPVASCNDHADGRLGIGAGYSIPSPGFRTHSLNLDRHGRRIQRLYQSARSHTLANARSSAERVTRSKGFTWSRLLRRPWNERLPNR